MFKEYAESVQVFDDEGYIESYLDNEFAEYKGIDESNSLYNFIDWEAARKHIMLDLERTEVNSKIYLWRKI